MSESLPKHRQAAGAIASVGVVGCGLMGSGIAEVAARAGYPVTVR
ncbi:MAG: 3-hydroxyacyl-CoA dehydrogenase NAD-binding domain-containing protein, partial [Chloroflexota bacterium]